MNTKSIVETAVRVIACGPRLDQHEVIAACRALEGECATMRAVLSARGESIAAPKDEGDCLAYHSALQTHRGECFSKLTAPTAPAASMSASAQATTPKADATTSTGPSNASLTSLEEQAATATEKLQLAAGVTSPSAVRSAIAARAEKSLPLTSRALKAQGCATLAEAREKRSKQGYRD